LGGAGRKGVGGNARAALAFEKSFAPTEKERIIP